MLKGRDFLAPTPGPIFAFLVVILLLFRRYDQSVYSPGLEGEKRLFTGTRGISRAIHGSQGWGIHRRGWQPFPPGNLCIQKVISFTKNSRRRGARWDAISSDKVAGRDVRPVLLNRNRACSPWGVCIPEVHTQWTRRSQVEWAAPMFPWSAERAWSGDTHHSLVRCHYETCLSVEVCGSHGV